MKGPVLHKEISSAMKLFKKIITNHGMQKHQIQGWESDIILPFLVDEEAWLGVWMLKSDELASVLTNYRIWDVAYQANNKCLEGVKPVPLTEIDSDMKNIDSYKKTSLATEDVVPFGLRYKICETAFFDSLNIDGNKVGIKRIFTFGYDIDKPLENGEYLPFSSLNNLFAKTLNEFNMEVNASRRRDLEHTTQRDLQHVIE